MECRGITVNWDEFAEAASDSKTVSDEVVSLFTKAFGGLLSVNRTLMVEYANGSEQGKYLLPFLEVFDTARENATRALREQPPEANPDNIATAIRFSALPRELMAYADYVEAEAVSIDAKLNAAEELQDSVKEIIKKAWNPWWLDPVLKALDEVLDIFRGGKE